MLEIQVIQCFLDAKQRYLHVATSSNLEKFSQHRNEAVSTIYFGIYVMETFHGIKTLTACVLLTARLLSSKLLMAPGVSIKLQGQRSSSHGLISPRLCSV